MMTDAMTAEKIREMIEGENVCIFSSLEAHGDGQRVRSHPMSPQFVDGQSRIWFLTESGARKLGDLAADPDVTLAFDGGASGWYVSLMGRASVVVDRDRVKQLWSAPMMQYFEGPDDSRIVLIGFDAVEADYWDGPNALLAGIKMLTTAVTGEPSDMGKSGRLPM